jgi:hypothetical protein
VSTATPTLGWLVLAWLCRHLPSPRDETLPYRPAAWQVRRTLRWYELDSEGKRLWNRCHDEDPKGKGKSPHAGATAICEFRGPVVFAGWAREGDVYACGDHGCRCGWAYAYRMGEAKGKPWGSPGLPSPWVQVAAVSEAQTANTWAALHAFLAANDGRLAEWLRLEPGRTLVYWRDRVDAKIERVTSSASSRTGQPITHAVMDEPQEWTPELRGPTLANTILENLTKLDGWAHFTGNAPVLGRGSVAEMLAEPAARALHIAPRPSVEPLPEMTRDELRPLVTEVYEETPWAPVERILDDIEDRAAHPWPNSRRLFLNLPWDGRDVDRWMPADLWARVADPELVLSPKAPTFVAVRVAHDHRSGAIASAQRRGDQVIVMSEAFTAPAGQYLSTGVLEERVQELRCAYPSQVMAVKKYSTSPRAREYQRPLPGPEVAYHGSFFEGSAQRLTAAGAVMVDVPSSHERMTPAAETLMRLVTDGQLVHDGDPETATQMSAVVAREAAKGWSVDAAEGATPGEHQRIVAAQAVMLAAHRALNAPPAARQKHTVHGLPGRAS